MLATGNSVVESIGQAGLNVALDFIATNRIDGIRNASLEPVALCLVTIQQ